MSDRPEGPTAAQRSPIRLSRRGLPAAATDTAADTPCRDGWHVVVPVKDSRRGKSRLAPFAGHFRQRLAVAFALDTIAATLTCPEVDQVLVVSSDPEVSAAALGLGARVIPDRDTDQLNAAARRGLRAVHAAGCGRGKRAVLLGDLPSLRPAELAATLRAAAVHPAAFVRDWAGDGTTLLTGVGRALSPRFGRSSAAAHARSGAEDITAAAQPTVRRDVDCAADLCAAASLGLGPRSRAVIESGGWQLVAERPLTSV